MEKIVPAAGEKLPPHCWNSEPLQMKPVKVLPFLGSVRYMTLGMCPKDLSLGILTWNTRADVLFLLLIES